MKRTDTILVCGKCLKRHPEGKALRRALKTQAKSADAKLVRTSCLGVCPKAAVVIGNGAALASRRVVIVHSASEIGHALRAMASGHPRPD